ncbi:MAG: hypothetical protein KKD48_02600 [Nanoarchaeota archaeon]|nr:hypothetical protein [Nanoarchaeota archaeon]
MKKIKKKKKSQKSIIKKLDNKWAKLVKLKAKEKCQKCGKTEHLNSHHIFSRSNQKVRWFLPNGVCLCPSCHVFSNYSAHKAPVEFIEWLKEKNSDEWYKELRMEANKTDKVDKMLVDEYLNNELKQVDN